MSPCTSEVPIIIEAIEEVKQATNVSEKEVVEKFPYPGTPAFEDLCPRVQGLIKDYLDAGLGQAARVHKEGHGHAH